MLMNDEYGAAGSEMTDSWHIFGDPSLLIRTQTPQILEVTHPSSLIIGESSVTVYSDVENARIALVQGGIILATGLISGGACVLEFEPLSSVELIQVTGTAFNHMPYSGSIQVQPPNAPYLVYEQSEIMDQSGNNNALADFNETIQLNITAQNIGLPFCSKFY
jgi:gingipain R